MDPVTVGFRAPGNAERPRLASELREAERAESERPGIWVVPPSDAALAITHTSLRRLLTRQALRNCRLELSFWLRVWRGKEPKWRARA
jgi:hypothetical protein